MTKINTVGDLVATLEQYSVDAEIVSLHVSKYKRNIVLPIDDIREVGSDIKQVIAIIYEDISE